MENAFIEIGKQVPALGVLAFLVIVFLKTITSRDKSFSVAIDRRDKVIDGIADRATKCIDENNKQLGENSKMLSDSCRALEKLERTIDRTNGD